MMVRECLIRAQASAETSLIPGSPITHVHTRVQYTSTGAPIHYVELSTRLNLMLRYVVHSCSQNAYVCAVYTFLQPDDFLVFAFLYSSSLSSLFFSSLNTLRFLDTQSNKVSSTTSSSHRLSSTTTL